jgi:hypothetical protein
MRSLKTLPGFLLVLCLVRSAQAGPIEARLAEAYGGVDSRLVDTGVLYDRVLPLSGIERFDGRPGAPAASDRLWLQLYDELRRASGNPDARPAPSDLRQRADRSETVPLALLFDRYQRVAQDAVDRGNAAIENGRLRILNPQALETHQAFAAAALRPVVWRGACVSFSLDAGLVFTNTTALQDLQIDFADGAGYRAVTLGAPLTAHYATTGAKVLRIRARTGAETVEAAAAIEVRAMANPLPTDTLHVTGTIPYLGAVASGDAYVDLAPGHADLQNPAVVVEGFDLDNSMNWDELYTLLNTQNLLEDLRADGYDIIVLNFTDATDYIERNSMLLVELLTELRGMIPPGNTMALAGASMGGLVSRYALAYMETHGMPHSVRTYISFDSPHLGANIPLGVQHWVRFFSGQSTDAAFLLSRLNQPAAREMLVYHYTDPAGTTGQPDPLRATFLTNLAGTGSWPDLTRNVAICNGSGTAVGEPFGPGAQVVAWNYSDLLVSITGNVWAVPNNTPVTKIFDGKTRILFSTTSQAVNVSTTLPYDNAPGGWRASMAEMDSVVAPYGDIVALYPNHCFIPTMSALCYDNPDLFHAVSSDANPVAHTPFDVVYWPSGPNQEHVQITAENAVWLKHEVEAGVTGVGPEHTAARLQLDRPSPNPSSAATQIAFSLPTRSQVDIRVWSVEGREVARLASGTFSEGRHTVTWSGADARGHRAAPGVYFVRLAAAGQTQTRRLVRLF